MATLTLQIYPPDVRLPQLHQAQVCYVVLDVGAAGVAGTRPVNWALVADASRSMRIPIVDEAQFRALVQQGGAQETLVDGVPVWQLSGPVPPDVRAASQSALDHVARALHTVVERLDARDRFALVGCAEQAVLLNHSTPGNARAELVGGIERLKTLNLGEQTDLAQGIELALQELRRGRDGRRAERLLLLTDGFTQRPEACIQLAAQAADEGVAISTVGLGGEFQEDVLTSLADQSGGRAVFLSRPRDIPQVVGQELDLARAVAARAVTLRVTVRGGTILRRITRIRPGLVQLFEAGSGAPPDQVQLGDINSNAPVRLLLELLAPPTDNPFPVLAQVALAANGAPAADARIQARFEEHPPELPAVVRDAAARVTIARLQRRGLDQARAGNVPEAIRLFQAAAQQLEALGERSLAEIARQQAEALERGGRLPPIDTKELIYATRRLGGG